jgi:UDPglucose 6-dehydrogenase
MKPTVAVIGAGFVGSAVVAAFNHTQVDLEIVDPRDRPCKALGKNLKIADITADICFVCVPTPSMPNGDVDVSIVNEVLRELVFSGYSGIVVIKSTITGNYLTQLTQTYSELRIVYNPEFLTERNAIADFQNPQMQILGGEWSDCVSVEQLYAQHSKIKVAPTFKTDIISASLLKYAINSWLATKVTFMNELYQMHMMAGADTTWEQFTDMLSRDNRIGNSHLQVPGPDGNFGFGGHCFPKDTQGLLQWARSVGVDLSVLDQATEKNIKIRS